MSQFLVDPYDSLDEKSADFGPRDKEAGYKSLYVGSDFKLPNAENVIFAFILCLFLRSHGS